MSVPRCAVCTDRLPPNKHRWCDACAEAYEREAHDVGDVFEVIRWAARRARWYAQRRSSAARALAWSAFLRGQCEGGDAAENGKIPDDIMRTITRSFQGWWRRLHPRDIDEEPEE